MGMWPAIVALTGRGMKKHKTKNKTTTTKNNNNNNTQKNWPLMDEERGSECDVVPMVFFLCVCVCVSFFFSRG